MLPVEIVPGLLRWSAPHPGWEPGAAPGSSSDWEETVGSVMFEAEDCVVLIDPQLPRDGREEFLERLDELVAGRPVSVLTTIRWHRRDRDELAARYAANSSRAWNAVPPGVEPRPLRGAGETMYWLPSAAALVPGDRLLGDPERGLRVCPESWLSRVQVDRAGLARLIGALIELPIERVLVSHGQPVLHDGRAAVARAVADAGGGSGTLALGL
ncbi:MAG TPA: hypothetical protein VII01_07770 [Solirubrobacteraceae bacterium]